MEEMRIMFKKILVVLMALVAAFVIVVALQPAEFKIARSITIDAPAAEVFPQVNDLHNWEAWSPWAKLDPNAKNTFEGPPAGTGSIFKWAGNEKVGEGMMTVTESKPSELVKIKLDFVKPFVGTNVTQFDFKDEGKQTLVTWTMTGANDNFMGKAFFLCMFMDKKLGTSFEEGLANLKRVVEKAK